MTTKERFKIIPYVSLLLKKDDKLLLIRRLNTGHDDGLYGCAGGGVDGNEPVTDAAIREAKEELGIILKKEHLKIAHVLHRKDQCGIETLGFFIEASHWEGDPQNMEPHKCDDVSWFAPDALPNNMQPTLKHVMTMLKSNNCFYSEFGWE